MSFTQKVINNTKNTTQEEKRESCSYPKVKEILEGPFKNLNYSDAYLYCCINGLLKKECLAARKKIESIISEEGKYK